MGIISNLRLLCIIIFISIIKCDRFLVVDKTPNPYNNNKYAETSTGCVLNYIVEITNLDNNTFELGGDQFSVPPVLLATDTTGFKLLFKLVFQIPVDTATTLSMVAFNLSRSDNLTLHNYTCESPPVVWINQAVSPHWYYSNQYGYYTKLKLNFIKKLGNIALAPIANIYNIQILPMKMKVGEYIVTASPKIALSVTNFTTVSVPFANSFISTNTHFITLGGFVLDTSIDLFVSPSTVYPLTNNMITPLTLYYFGNVQPTQQGVLMGLSINQVFQPIENRIVGGNPSNFRYLYDVPISSPSGNVEYAFTFIANSTSMFRNPRSFNTVSSVTSPFVATSASVVSNSFLTLTLYEHLFNMQNLVLMPLLTFTYRALTLSLYMPSPMGQLGGDFKLCQASVPVTIPNYNTMLSYNLMGNTYTQTIGGSTDTVVPTLYNLEFIKVGPNKVLIWANIQDNLSGFYIMKMFSNNELICTVDYRDLVDGDSVNGYYERYEDFLDINHPFKAIDIIQVYDLAGNLKVYQNGFYDFNAIPVIEHYIQNTEDNYLLHEITSIRFALNDIDLSITGAQNAIYFNISDANKESGVAIKFFINVKNTDPNRYVFYGKWNNQINMFAINFELPPRMFTGNVEYSIWYPDLSYSSIDLLISLGPSSQLRVISENADLMPPVFVGLWTIPGNTQSVLGEIDIGFNITISSGFKSGMVSVISSIDGYANNFTIVNDNNDGYVSPYNVLVTWNVKNPCKPEVFTFNYIYLEDLNGAYSEYTINEATSGISPLMIFQDSTETKLTISCVSSPVDLLPPVLTNISYTNKPAVINVNSPLESKFDITICAQDTSLINLRHLPYCLITGLYTDHYTVQSVISTTSPTQDVVCWVCHVQLPYMFAGPWPYTTSLGLAIYGYADRVQNFGGSRAVDTRSLNGYQDIVIQLADHPPPYIESTSKYYSYGGSLTIFGRNFGDLSGATFRLITATGIQMSMPLSYTARTMAIINYLPGTSPTGFTLTLSFNGVDSNAYQGQIVESTEPYIPQPTTQPTQCSGSPLCGGPNNGECNNNKCKCKDPWTGTDCLSQNIIISPEINTTSPDTGNDYKTELDGNQISLKTLISVISLNELNRDGSIYTSHNLTTWRYTNTTSTNTSTNYQEYLYETSIVQGNLNTSVKVLLKFYLTQDTIYFANEYLDMLPSTLKYQVTISPYKFQSSLNTLQLVMASSMQSNTTDNSCSYIEDNLDNNQYVKLQVNEHSLYGRFIKRAIVDNRILTITNTILNNQSQSNQVQNQIGINIPNYKYSVTLDPDFSVLVDSKPASNKYNAVCDYQRAENSSTLTQTQLIGIIIGCVAFGVISLIIITYFAHKKSSAVRVMTHKFKNNIANVMS
ncbi:EGF-like domain-containing protein [Tieghemostelium lacteum]|uniref:EGF-like domain-containing protein n=1 Tax=Tieghemostelium lacteum TaxID=361077 RepID=A0A151ZCW0_TIELA|nr:EGF-like domain-containing protein [Tieghemostelium lacteum]|eukprot:KYQ91780.1 EGF-like domain-containing protein [Tieghemostelium lacteum]